MAKKAAVMVKKGGKKIGAIGAKKQMPGKKPMDAKQQKFFGGKGK